MIGFNARPLKELKYLKDCFKLTTQKNSMKFLRFILYENNVFSDVLYMQSYSENMFN